ncbi:MAG: hypothetical protein ACYCVD_03655 [Desulfitobacteriaceae bacterium]
MQLKHIIKAMQGTPKIKDSVVLSLLSGLIGTLLMDSSNFLLWRGRKTEALYGHLAGSMLMYPFRTNRRKNFVIGQILHMVTGAVLAYPLTIIFKKTGKDHHLIKGAFFGTVTWEFIYGLGKRFNIFTTKPHLTKTHYSAFLDNILYGIGTAQTIVSLADSNMFPTSHDNLMAEKLRNDAAQPIFSPSKVNDNTQGQTAIYQN